MPHWYWIWMTGAGLLGIASLAWLLSAIAWDQWKRRKDKSPRCRACWYSMEGATSLTCPECGHIAKNATELQRPRRRYVQAMIAVLCVALCYHLWLVPQRHKRGERWTSLIPTTVLVIITPIETRWSTTSHLVEAMLYRSWEAWDWQRNIVAARQILAATDAELESCVHTRTMWPAGAEIVLRASMHNDMYSISAWRRLDIQSTDGRGVHVGEWEPNPIPLNVTCALGYGQDAEPIPPEALVNPLPIGRHDLSFTTTLSGPWGMRRTRHHTVQIEVVAPENAGIVPVDEQKFRDIVSQSLRVRATNEYSPLFKVDMDSQFVFDELYRSRYNAKLTPVCDPSIAVQIDVLDGDHAVWSCGVERYGWKSVNESSTDEMKRLAWNNESCEWNRQALSRLKVRVRGDLGLTARDFEAQQYWSGEITIPMKEILDQTDRANESR